MKIMKVTILVFVLGCIIRTVPVWGIVVEVTPANVVLPDLPGELLSFDLVISSVSPDVNAAGFQCTIGVSPPGELTLDSDNSEAVATDLGYWIYGNPGGGAYAHSLGGDNYEFADSPSNPEILLVGDIMARYVFIWGGTIGDYTFTLDLNLNSSYVLLDNGTTTEPLQLPNPEPPWWSDPIVNATSSSFTITIPEPATICLLGLGALSLIRGRKNSKGFIC